MLTHWVANLTSTFSGSVLFIVLFFIGIIFINVIYFAILYHGNMLLEAIILFITNNKVQPTALVKIIVITTLITIAAIIDQLLHNFYGLFSN